MLLLLRSRPQQAALKGTLSLGSQKRKERKTRKSRSEEKVVSYSSVSLFLARKMEAVTQDRTRGIEHPTRRKTQGANIVKSWENKRDRGSISDTFT